MWLELEIYCPITKDLESGEEMSELDEIRLKNEGVLIDGYETEQGFYNLAVDMIKQLNPKVFIPKGGVNKRFATEIVFDSGTVVYAKGKPSDVYKKVIEYVDSLPD